MTKEELEKEAEDFWWNDDNCSGALPTEKIYECGYLAGAEPREKCIAELEAQIEEMKFDVKANIKWADEHENNQMYFKLNSMFNQWEIKEK